MRIPSESACERKKRKVQSETNVGYFELLLSWDIMDALGTSTIMLIMHFVFVLASWLYLYSSRKSKREALLWGIIALVLPFIGAWAMLFYFLLKRASQD